MELKMYIEKLAFMPKGDPMTVENWRWNDQKQEMTDGIWVVSRCQMTSCQYFDAKRHLCTANKEQHKQRNDKNYTSKCYWFNMSFSQMFNFEVKKSLDWWLNGKLTPIKWWIKYDMFSGTHNNAQYGKKIDKKRMFPYKKPHMGHIKDIWKELKGRELTRNELFRLKFGRELPSQFEKSSSGRRKSKGYSIGGAKGSRSRRTL